MEFNRENIDAFRKDAEAALKDVAQRYDMEIDMEAVVYNLEKESFKFRAIGGNIANSKTGIGLSKTTWNDNCERFALTPSMFGKTVDIKGEIYEVVGINPRGRTKPVIIESADGNRYVVSDRLLRKQLS